MSPTLFTPFTLASGQTLRNRIAKAAMEEGLAGAGQAPDDRLVALYRHWGVGGAGGHLHPCFWRHDWLRALVAAARRMA